MQIIYIKNHKKILYEPVCLNTGLNDGYINSEKLNIQ